MKKVTKKRTDAASTKAAEVAELLADALRWVVRAKKAGVLFHVFDGELAGDPWGDMERLVDYATAEAGFGRRLGLARKAWQRRSKKSKQAV